MFRFTGFIIAIVMIVAGFQIISSNQQVSAETSGLTKAEIEQIIHDYLMDNPQVIMDSVNNGQAKIDQAKIDQALERHSDYLFNNIQGFNAGNPDGDVTIVEFFDYNCGYCKKVRPDVFALLDEDPNLNLVLIEFPILGQSSLDAARWALAAREQGKYIDFHNALMEHRGGITDTAIEQVAKTAGVNWEQLKSDYETVDYRSVIANHHDIAKAFGFRGTPAFIIGDEAVGGAIDINQMRELIAAARSEEG